MDRFVGRKLPRLATAILFGGGVASSLCIYLFGKFQHSVLFTPISILFGVGFILVGYFSFDYGWRVEAVAGSITVQEGGSLPLTHTRKTFLVEQVDAFAVEPIASLGTVVEARLLAKDGRTIRLGGLEQRRIGGFRDFAAAQSLEVRVACRVAERKQAGD